jgi:predicted metal-dependent enzyme (double-stranded beta helix superfamily)
MLDVDDMVERFVQAVRGDEPHLAVREILTGVVADSGSVVASMGEAPAGLNILYRAPDLTVINAVWPPHMSLFPHDHRMWAAIGIYGGAEDNTFFRRRGSVIVDSGGKSLSEGDVLLLGDDAVHSVRNPARRYTGAVHVYGGDFVDTPRSQWDEETHQERPYDLEVVRALFDRAQRDAGLDA